MTQPDYTEGPWEVAENPLGGKHFVVSAPLTGTGGRASRQIVAALPPHNPRSAGNARLIAAAPALLAACEAARAYFGPVEGMCPRNDSCDDCKKGWAMSDQLAAAIALTRGEA